VLVHWRDEQASLAMWEDLDDFRSRFPDFQLEDELASRGGRCHVRPHLPQAQARTRCPPGGRARDCRWWLGAPAG
jgi:hypothetical protein